MDSTNRIVMWRRAGMVLVVLLLLGAAAGGAVLLLRQGREPDAAALREAALAGCERVETDAREALLTGLRYADSVCGVDMSGQQFVEIPDGMFRLRELSVLQANGNFITSLPATAGDARSLRLLEVRDNKLKSLPRELGRLRELQLLDVRGNPLSEAEVATMRALLPETLVLF